MPKSFAITNIGQKRKLNQDYVYFSDGPLGCLPNLYIVADGMGGHKAGDYASKYTVDQLTTLLTTTQGTEIEKVMDEALHRVNTELRAIAGTNENYYGMGTTLVGAWVDGESLHAVNIGDSRLYLVDDTLHQITVDHSLVEEMVLAGGLDEKRARNHPDKNIITRAIGAEDRLKVDYFTCPIHPGQLLLLCSDGLTNMLDDIEISRILAEQDTLEQKAKALVDAANDNGGKDNITVILVNPFLQD